MPYPSHHLAIFALHGQPIQPLLRWLTEECMNPRHLQHFAFDSGNPSVCIRVWSIRAQYLLESLYT